MSLIANLHCHDDIGSVFDGVASPAENVARAKELGAKAVCMTNHGTMVSTWDYRDACKNADIKFIPGIEFYVEMPNSKTRRHLICLAKSFTGYQAICKVVSETAFNNVDGYPIVTEGMLNKWFAQETMGHGEVIATSACMQGVLSSYLLWNKKIEKEEEKIRKKQGSRPDLSRYNSILNQIEENEIEIKKQRDIRDENKKKSGDKILYDNSVKKIEELTNENKKLRVERDTLKIPVEKFNKYEEKITELNKELVSERTAKQNAKREAEKYVSIFGEGNFYIELQYHGIEEEAYCMPILADIAKSLKIPVVAANDSHMVYKEDAEKRQAIWAQHYGWKEIREEDKELYIKTDEELTDALLKILPNKIVKEAIGNIEKIVDQCNVEFTAGTHYPKFTCPEGAKLHLRKLIRKGKAKVENWNEEYQKRLSHELKVIESMGFSDYFCIIEDFLNYARVIGKLDLDSDDFLNHKFDMKYLTKLAKNEVGEGCGPGRGSAAGSLVAYLVGITNIDPIKNELLFERFLNPERVTMPDIDSDIAPKVRPFVIEYIKNKYGEKAVCQILTRGFFGAKSAIQAGARVLGKKMGDDKMFVKLSLEMTKSLEDPNVKLSEIESDLLKKFEGNENAKDILHYAKLIEGRCQNYGTHAAGIIISDNQDVSDYLPLIKVTDAIDCSCDLNYVEPLGMLKLDLLGLRNLGIITECEKAIQKATGKMLSMDKFPIDKKVFSEIFAKGKTNGVFQFESDGMKKTLINFGPESISDLTLLNAIFRPGPLQYIDEVTAVKKGEKKPNYIIPEMKSVLGSTYGKPIYQEQIMSIFNKFAGFSLGEADVIRRYMSKKKTEKFAAYKDKFIEGLVAHGATKENSEKFWEELLDFSAYAFNKSHARAYAEVAYATAYLKYYYPAAYTVGLLNYTASDKREAVLTEAMRSGIKIAVPDINIAEENFILNNDKVIYGLSSVTQVAASAESIIKERKENGAFISFVDFLKRCPLRKNAIENLIKAGAFDSFSKSRDALLIALPDKLKALSDYENWKAKDVFGITDKKKLQIETKLEEIQAKIDAPITPVTDNTLTRLLNEKDVIGYFVSDNPVPEKTEKKELSEIEDKGDVVVFINSCEVKKSKMDNTFAKIACEDRSGSANCIAFGNIIQKYYDLIKEGNVVTLSLYKKEDGTFVVNKAEKYVRTTGDIRLSVSSYKSYKDNKKLFFNYKGTKRLVLYCRDTGKFIKTDELVSPDIYTSKKITSL